MITNVQFWPRWKAECETFLPSHAVISITDPGQAPASIRGAGALLRLEFFDLTAPVQGDARFAADSLFNSERAASLISFLQRLQAESQEHLVVVHCEAGVSRSSAVALFVEAFTGCSFPLRAQSDLANTLVLRILAAQSGVALERPPHYQPPGGLILSYLP